MASGSARGRRHRDGVLRGRAARRRGRPRCDHGPHGGLGLSGDGAGPGSLPAEDQSGPRTTGRPGAVHHDSHPHGPAVRSPMACRRVRARGPDRCPRRPGPTGLLPAARQPVPLAPTGARCPRVTPVWQPRTGDGLSRPARTPDGRGSGAVGLPVVRDRPGGSRWLYEAAARLRIFRRKSSGPHPVPWNTGGSRATGR